MARVYKKPRKLKPLKIEVACPTEDKYEEAQLSGGFEEDCDRIVEKFQKNYDYVKQMFDFGKNQAALHYLSTMVDEEMISSKLIPTFSLIGKEYDHPISENDLEMLERNFLLGIHFKESKFLSEIIKHLLDGKAVVLIENIGVSLVFDVGHGEQRSINEPTTQTIIRGPKDGFVEDVSTNISLMRRRMKNVSLTFEEMIIGEESQTTIIIGYLEGAVNQKILEELKTRLENAQMSTIFDSGYLEEVITDNPYTPFPLITNTERPDTACACIAEGKITVLVDGSPFALLLPSVFTDFFQSTEDYSESFFVSSIIRIVRYISFLISLTLPSLYVALTTFHQELIPTNLLISIQAQRNGVPFPAFVEVLLMELTFEVLREAGVRMPRAVGQTVSIVGALVLGQAAVQAGLVSDVLVVVVAFSAIASFVAPIYKFAASTRMLRYVYLLLGFSLGLLGILVGMVIMVVHLVSLKTFGVPYLSPVAPYNYKDLKDSLIRFPLWKIQNIPDYLKNRGGGK